MPKKKKDQQDEGYVSDSTCDSPPKAEKEGEVLEDAPESEKEEPKAAQPEQPTQQPMFETKEVLEGNAHERNVTVGLVLQIGDSKISLLKAKDRPTSAVPEMLYKALLMWRHTQVIIDALLDIPEERKNVAFELRDRIRATIREYNAEKQAEIEAAKKKREEEEKIAKDKRDREERARNARSQQDQAEREERKKKFKVVKPGDSEPEAEEPSSDEPPSYDDQVAADEPITAEAPETF